jgi:lipopolysaccharide/colanic/teichoic acid biosynthesis glycosyltransferase
MSTSTVKVVTAGEIGSATGSSRLTEIACRALDIVVASLCLLALMPFFLVLAIAIKLDSPGRVIFRQRRLGRNVEPFTVNKFRTMGENVDHEEHRAYVQALIRGEAERHGDEAVFKLAKDHRITRLGGFLRRSSIDELPQLWNVLRGEMSLVGPRPPVQYEVDHYPPHFFERFAVRPGLTGLWQISGRSLLTVEEMIALDCEYVRRRSVWLNVSILLRTVPAVLFRRGAA